MGRLRRNHAEVDERPQEAPDVSFHRGDEERFGEQINGVGEFEKTRGVSAQMRAQQLHLKITTHGSEADETRARAPPQTVTEETIFARDEQFVRVPSL